MEEETILLTERVWAFTKLHMQLHLYAILLKKWDETDLVALTHVLSKEVQMFVVFSKDLYYQQQLSIFCFIIH